MPLNHREKSRFFRPAVDNNEEISDHVRVHIEAFEKSKIPKKENKKHQKRQLENSMPYLPAPYVHSVYSDSYPITEKDDKPHIHVSVETEKRHQVPSRQRRDLATEYTKNIVVPDRAENNLGVVHQKRVEEDYENSGKRNKILKLDKRDVFMPSYWEPRATIRGAKVTRNPILQLLRAAAGQKTQRILGLNSKAFDIFPGPLPEEQNVALHNNLGKVTSEPPAKQYRASVDQQIMRSFNRPFRRHRYVMGRRYQPIMAMYPQAAQHQRLPQQFMEQEEPMFQHREYTPMQRQLPQLQPQQQLMPDQEMSPFQADPQSEGVFQESGFSRFLPFTHEPQIPQQFSAYQQERPQYRELIMPQQQEMFPMFQHAQPVPMEEIMPREEQPPQQMFMRPNSYPMDRWSQGMFRPEPLQEMAPQTRELPQYPQYHSYQTAPESEVPASPRGLPSSTEVLKAPSLPEMKYDQDSGMLTEPSLEHSSIPGLIAQKVVSMRPLAESQQINGGSLREIPSSLSTVSSKLYQLPSSFSSDRSYLPELPWLDRARQPFPTFRSQPYIESPTVSQRHAVASHVHRVSHIPHTDDDDEFDDEKPEVHVHIQTEKSHISKPTESDVKRAGKLKKS